MTTPRGGTSRVTTAPAATNASSPTSTPGVSTAAPPIRQARRSTAPRSSYDLSWRDIVESLVVTAPGPRNTSSSTTEYAVRYTSVCTRTRSPTTTSLSTALPRPITEPAPIRARSRTNAWSPTIAPGPMRAPANTTAPQQITAPSSTTSGSPASREAVECRASFGGLPSAAASYNSQPAPTTVPGCTTT